MIYVVGTLAQRGFLQHNLLGDGYITEITVAGQRWAYTKLSPLHLVAVLHQNQQIYLYSMTEKVEFH